MTTIQEKLDAALTHYNTLLIDNNAQYYYNYTSAVPLFTSIADIGIYTQYYNDYPYEVAVAAYYTGECYYYGRGVKKNVGLAQLYLNESKDPRARSMLAVMASDGHNDGETLTSELYKDAIEHNPNDGILKYNFAKYKYSCTLLIDDDTTLKKSMLQEALDLASKATTLDVSEAFCLVAKIIRSIELISSDEHFVNELPLYLKSAERGALIACGHICTYYFNNKQYEEMIWWYWWATTYDPRYKNRNKKIAKIIEATPLLSNTLETMTSIYSHKFYKIVRKKGDNRLYDEVHKHWFMDSLCEYYRDKVASEYFTFDQKQTMLKTLQELQRSSYVTDDEKTRISSVLEKAKIRSASASSRSSSSSTTPTKYTVAYDYALPLYDKVTLVLQKYEALFEKIANSTNNTWVIARFSKSLNQIGPPHTLEEYKKINDQLTIFQKELKTNVIEPLLVVNSKIDKYHIEIKNGTKPKKPIISSKYKPELVKKVVSFMEKSERFLPKNKVGTPRKSSSTSI